MLALQSMAEDLGVSDVRLLFSSAELSRIRWRRGPQQGEFVVDVDPAEVPDPGMVFDIGQDGSRAGTPNYGESACSSFSSPRVYTTIVGQYDDLALGCPGIRMPPS